MRAPTLTYFYLQAKRYQDAIKVGENLRADRRSARRKRRPPPCLPWKPMPNGSPSASGSSRTPADMKADQDKMLDLAKYMEETWKGELPAEMARHEIGLLYLHRKKLREAITELSAITPAYSSFVFARYQLGEAALQAEKENLPPLEGDKPGDYRARALKAFESIPESALGTDPAD